MKTGILRYPGGHGETDLKNVLAAFVEDIQYIWYTDPGPFDVDVIFIPGGFPCKHLRSTVEFSEGSPAVQHLKDFAASGRFIFGINNGFQLLCSLDLLPGDLIFNSNKRFVCKYVYVKPENQLSVLTSNLKKDELFYIPVATMYGNYLADEHDLVKMRQEGQIIFRYCDSGGRITESVNILGSTDNIAAICNVQRNVFGMIPQPERAMEDNSGHADGYRILESMIQEINI